MFHAQGVSSPTSPDTSLDVALLGQQFADAVGRWHEDVHERQTIHRLRQFGQWLKSVRTCRALSRAELANQAGIAPSQLLLLERGLLRMDDADALLPLLAPSLSIPESLLQQRFHDITGPTPHASLQEE